ncbi:thyroid peroxidase-like isoform X3 [Takifugu rubripes]|nr:thyroid peroxidase-like isoform X3 [Takifugu rubripes]XP_029687761.1 thyroid peroxidase-like isoform X3 [Takifugu rubripes]
MDRCAGRNVLVVAAFFCALHPGAPAEDATRLNSTTFRHVLASHGDILEAVRQVQSRQRPRALLSSTGAFPAHQQPENGGVSIPAEVFQASLQVLKIQRQKRDAKTTEPLQWDDVELMAQWSGCSSAPPPLRCQHSDLDKYRSISGICNNRENPLWGAASMPLVRWLPAEYEDGQREPKGWNRGRLYNGVPLPSVTEVSRRIVRSTEAAGVDIYSHMLVEWGQFIDHDISFTPQSSATDCLTTCTNIRLCFPIQTGDAQGCLPFFRSVAACSLSLWPDVEQVLQRQQINTVTSFMDASQIYGSTAEVQLSLRDLAGLNGKLVINSKFRDPNGRDFLPPVGKRSRCRQSPEGERVECFHAGDSRANEGLHLASLHTLFHREHNRIAAALKGMNDHWSPEMIYQETRRIIAALLQIITMRDYVPKIIGAESWEDHMGPYCGYDPSVNPSVANVFSTAALRFGHGTISPKVSRLNQSFQEHELFPSLNLHNNFFVPWRFTQEGGVDPLVRGAIGTPADTRNTHMFLSDEVTDRLIVLNVPRLMDLAALNLQRGRDHALPGYNAWRQFCGLKRIQTLSDLKAVVGNCRVARKIWNMYKHPDNIDVWLGGLFEKFLPGARVGPLFSCLIGRQMKAIRDGDRFWWEAEGVFTRLQKAALLNGSLSRIICDNTDIKQLLPDSFLFRQYPSGYTSCDQLPSVNLEAWREEESQELKCCGRPGTVENGDFILSSTSGKLAAHYSCYHGFQLRGAAAIVCEGTRWSDPPPRCERAPSSPDCGPSAGWAERFPASPPWGEQGHLKAISCHYPRLPNPP